MPEFVNWHPTAVVAEVDMLANDGDLVFDGWYQSYSLVTGWVVPV